MTTLTYTDPHEVTTVGTTDPPAYGRTASGYGAKIPTRFRIRYLGRWRRVYMMQYANSGSAYVVVNGQDVFLDSGTEHRLEERA